MTLITVQVEAKETHLVCETDSTLTYYREGKSPGINSSYKSTGDILISNGTINISVVSKFRDKFEITDITSSYIRFENIHGRGLLNRKNGDLLIHDGKYSEFPTEDQTRVYRLTGKCKVSTDKILF